MKPTANIRNAALGSLIAALVFTSGPQVISHAQNKFFGTPNRGIEGGKGNAQIKMLMDENVARRSETTQNAADIDALEGRMGTAEGDISALEASQTTQDSQISDNTSRIDTVETEAATVQAHAKAAMPGTCHDQNAKLRWNTTTSAWECVAEGDPTVQAFAKTVLPTCTGSQLLRSNGSGFTCVNAGSDYVISESDPQVGAVTAGKVCRGTGSLVECDQDLAAGDFVQKTGDSMSGPLSVPVPTSSVHVATKGYVDAAVAAAGGGSGGGYVCGTTRARYQGNLGGLAGADAKCAADYGTGWRMATPGNLAGGLGYGVSIYSASGWHHRPGSFNCSDWSVNTAQVAGHTGYTGCNYSGNTCGNVGSSSQDYCSSYYPILCCNF